MADDPALFVPQGERYVTLAERLAEVRTCVRDPSYFLGNYIYVRSQPDDLDDDEGLDEMMLDPETGLAVPKQKQSAPSEVTLLKPWPRQADLIDDLMYYHWVISGKSRKVGFTTIGIGFGNWIQIFMPYCRVHYFSRRDEAAKDMLARHIFSYDRLPKWMRLPVKKRNDHEFTIVGHDGSERTVMAYPTTEDTGIEQTADYTLLDEFASIPEPRASKVWGGIEPTIAPNGYVLMISRGKGPQGTFATLLRTAMARYGMPMEGDPEAMK